MSGSEIKNNFNYINPLRYQRPLREGEVPVPALTGFKLLIEDPVLIGKLKKLRTQKAPYAEIAETLGLSYEQVARISQHLIVTNQTLRYPRPYRRHGSAGLTQ